MYNCIEDTTHLQIILCNALSGGHEFSAALQRLVGKKLRRIEEEQWMTADLQDIYVLIAT